MGGWRQRRPGSNEKNLLIGKRKTALTLNGLLMEGLGGWILFACHFCSPIWSCPILSSHRMKRSIPSTRQFFSVSIVFLLLFWTPLGEAQASQENGPPRVTLCESAEHPELYAGKIIETQASVSGSD